MRISLGNHFFRELPARGPIEPCLYSSHLILRSGCRRCPHDRPSPVPLPTSHQKRRRTFYAHTTDPDRHGTAALFVRPVDRPHGPPGRAERRATAARLVGGGREGG